MSPRLLIPVLLTTTAAALVELQSSSEELVPILGGALSLSVIGMILVLLVGGLSHLERW